MRKFILCTAKIVQIAGNLIGIYQNKAGIKTARATHGCHGAKEKAAAFGRRHMTGGGKTAPALRGVIPMTGLAKDQAGFLPKFADGRRNKRRWRRERRISPA